MLFSCIAIWRLFFTFSFCFFHLMRLKYTVLRCNVLKTEKSVKIQNLLVWRRNEHVIKLEVTNTWHVSVLASEQDVLGEKEMLGRETREGRVRSQWRSGDTPKVVQGRLWTWNWDYQRTWRPLSIGRSRAQGHGWSCGDEWCFNSITLASKMGAGPGSKDRDETIWSCHITMNPKCNHRGL